MKRAARKQVQKFGTGGLNRYSSTMSDRLKAPKLSSKEQARIQQAIDQGFTNIAYHSTNTPWDEIDLNYTDVGFHAGTPTQATNRALDKAIQAGLQKTREEGKYIDTTNILPIAYRPGKTLVTPDVGEWKDAYETLLSLRNVPALRGQSWMDETLDYLESQRAPYERMKKLDEYQQSPENLRALSEIRDELLNQGYRQIRYENRVENALGSSTDLLPDYAEQVKRMTDEARALYKKGLSLRPESPPPDLGATQEAVEAWLAQTPRDPLSYLDPEEAALYAKYRDDVRRIENTPAFYDSPHSIIFLDPARDVRSANAPFAPEAAQEPGFWKKEGGLAKFGTGGLGKAATDLADKSGRAVEDALDTYYHGGKLTGPISEREGLFDGVFLSPSQMAARSHGESLYSFAIPPEKIAGSGDFMGYSDMPWEDQVAAILRTNRRINSDSPDFDLWYKAVVDDKAGELDTDDLARLFGKEDGAENVWEAQRQRGRLAKELGYDAVNMSDEHGTSVLLVRDRPYSPVGDRGTFDPANPVITKKDGGPVYDPSRINQMVDDLLDPMYEFEPYDDEAYEIKRFGTGGLNKVPSRQWLKDVVEQDVEPYLNYFGNPAQMAFDNWLKGTATKYLKRDFGTEFDPMRDLSIRHVQSDVWPPREIGPYSEPARAVNPMWQKLNPWLKDLDPETPVYTSLRPGTLEEPGLNMRHLRDELMNAMSAEAGLPRNLQIRPESLQRMSFPQASELVGKINQYRAEQMAAANAQRATNPATQLVKQYPEGYRWVQITPDADIPEGWQRLNSGDYRMPDGTVTSRGWAERAVGDALKYEGDTMGHCVGGYCDSVMSGASRIYSLRDAQGMPHVTIEAVPEFHPEEADFNEYWNALKPRLREQGEIPDRNKWFDMYLESTSDFAEEAAKLLGNRQRIIQIKGKGNRAPVDQYVPFVQDFVRSQDWTDVQELNNARLRDAAREFSGRPQPQQRYMTDAEYDDYLLQLLRDEQAPNMKEGGIVEDDFLNANPKGREPLTWTDLLARYAPDPMNALIAAFEMQTTPNERGLTGLALNTLAVPNVLKDLGSIGSSVIEGGVESLAPEAAERMRTASERGAASREMLVPGAIQDLASLAMEGSKRATNEYDALLDQMLASRGLGPADTLTWPNQFALALGEMLGQGPLPSAKKAEVAKAAATKLRDMIALPFEYILPTVDAKPSSYALGTALGGALRTAFSNPEEPPTTRELVENVPARPTRERMSYTPPAFPGMAEGGPVYDPARIESMVNELMEPKKFGTGGLNQVTGKAAGKAGVPGNLPEAERTIITDAVERELALPNSTVELLAPQRRANYGRSTIRGAGRKTYPRIFENPRIIVSSAAEQVAPESEALRRLFNVTREDLYDMSMAREPTVWLPPGAPKKPKGTAHASPIMLPANTQRLQDTLAEALNSPLRPGMIGWYMMDPAYQRLLQLADPEDAAQMFRDFNTLTGIHSAQSDVATELTRGSAMNWLNREGRLEDYIRFARKMGLPGAPLDMRNVPGHMGHKTSHLKPALRYLDTAQLSQQAKTPAYITASMPPELGTQSNFAVGDAHFSRAIGLPDVRNLVRNKKTGLYEPDVASWSMPEAMQLQDWWANKVAGPVGLQGVPGQALLWGAEAPITGVESLIGAPKLEILADLIMKTAARLNVSPEKARDLVLTGKTYAGYADGGLVSYLQHMARNER